MDELGAVPGISSHQFPVPDDTVDEATWQRLLSHPSSLNDRCQATATAGSGEEIRSRPGSGGAGRKYVAALIPAAFDCSDDAMTLPTFAVIGR